MAGVSAAHDGVAAAIQAAMAPAIGWSKGVPGAFGGVSAAVRAGVALLHRKGRGIYWFAPRLQIRRATRSQAEISALAPRESSGFRPHLAPSRAGVPLSC